MLAARGTRPGRHHPGGGGRHGHRSPGAADPGAAATGETILRGGPWATTLHVGPYAELPLAYTALLEHVRGLGHGAAGPITETYLTDPGTATPDELVTRIAVALER